MRAYLRIWIGLLIVAIVTSFGVTFALYRHIDLTFLHAASLLVATAAQAAVLAWQPGVWPAVWTPLRAGFAHVQVRPLLFIDAGLLLAGLVWWTRPGLGLGGDGGAQSMWIGVKALAGAVLWWRAAGTGGVTHARLAPALLLVVVAIQALTGGVDALVSSGAGAVPHVPEVIARVVCYGAIAWLAVRIMPDLALALAVPAVLAVVLSMFNHPGVVQPWRAFALASASLSVTAMCLAAVTRRGA